MSPTQRSKINKPDLMALLDETIDESYILTKLDVIINEFKQMKENNETMDNDIKRVKGTVDDHSKILSAHQKFMEDLDNDKRSKHLIVLRLKEDENENDQDKFSGIMDAIGIQQEDVTIETMMRLGQKNENQENRNRPLKVTFAQRAMRDNILRNSKKLKDQPDGSQYKRVFLKKDQHPDIRNEEKRLYEVFKAEKNKDENAEKEVVFNRRTRIVTVNGDEIDRFKLFSSFL